ncbi:uncharacterized protein LOC131678380 isoform X2 [Topomyia yanbarensis]|uniref:uncharacterized protein LOC131678380 isoform X2 n=1 Tax=Topomyia yanbarensis TaxID=2498891 RepID=UPI00273BF467|nr:uncharacterized protein LOC131678380 isoform X2 [Topomyia yanbarensis]
MDKPIVLVLSVDPTVEPESIITKVRKLPVEQCQEALADGHTGFGYHIQTKYYDTDVLFCPWKSTSELDTLPEAILNQTEGILIYFDSKDRNFLKRLPDYARFVTDADIEFGILLCSELQEESETGITYREAKQFCDSLDVIELEPSGETEEGEAAGVDELIQAMHNFIWSNVDMSRKGESSGGELVADVSGNSEEPSTADEDERRAEEEVKDFEMLLTQLMQFRTNTSSWTRNERLAYAQEFAEIFDDMIADDD